MDTPAALVGLDLGTSAVRAALWRNGRLAAQSRREIELHFPGPHRVEQDPRAILDACTACLEEACDVLRPGENAALGIAHQRSTVVLWDAESGAPFGPALSWRDARATEQASQLAARVKDVASRTGLPASPHYGAPKIAWALEHWPAARKAADSGRLRCGTLGTWLCWKLTRGESFAVDPTNAQRMLLLDVRTLAWDRDLVRASGIPESALPQVRPTDGAFGTALVSRHRLPVRAMMGDQQAALAALGDLAPHRALVQLGTGGFVLLPTGDTPAAALGLLTGIARADANRPRRYLVEGPVSSAGSALDRLGELGILREGDDLDELVSRATAPVTLVPAWAGLAAPWWEPSARAALMGWDESSTRADVVAGAVRGLAFLVADVLDFMSSAGLRVQELELSGSVARSACVAQAVADASARPVLVRGDTETTLEGILRALADATDAEAPAMPAGELRRVEPRADLSAARDAFAIARQAVMRMARRAT